MIGARAALELVLWRWARISERRWPEPPPAEVSLVIPKRRPDRPRLRAAEGAHWLDLLAPELAAALTDALGGERVDCRVPAWLVENYLIDAALRRRSEGATWAEVSAVFGKSESLLRRRNAERAGGRPNPLLEINQNVAAEVVNLLLRRKALAKTCNSAGRPE